MAYREGKYNPWIQSPDEYFHADQVPDPKRVKEAVAIFLKSRASDLSPYTLRNYRSALGILTETVGRNTYLERVKGEDITRFMSEIVKGSNRPAPSTQGFRLIAAKAFFGWCSERNLLIDNPAADVRPPKQKERLPKAATDAEFAAVLKHIPEGRSWTRSLFQFAASTGLRIGELGRLRWDHVDIERRLIVIERQKNGRAQTQPIPRTAVAILSDVERIDEYVFTAPNQRRRRQLKSWCMDVQRVFREAVESAGIERKLTPHSLRHRYCTKLAESGASAFVIQAAARHADVATSQRYVSIANQNLRAALDEVFDAAD
jgi:integrase/recombinase XerD